MIILLLIMNFLITSMGPIGIIGGLFGLPLTFFFSVFCYYFSSRKESFKINLLTSLGYATLFALVGVIGGPLMIVGMLLSAINILVMVVATAIFITKYGRK